MAKAQVIIDNEWSSFISEPEDEVCLANARDLFGDQIKRTTFNASTIYFVTPSDDQLARCGYAFEYQSYRHVDVGEYALDPYVTLTCKPDATDETTAIVTATLDTDRFINDWIAAGLPRYFLLTDDEIEEYELRARANGEDEDV